MLLFYIFTLMLTLTTRYFNRLDLDPSKLDSQPSINKLRSVREAHLSKIPFENLSQHGCSHSAVLDIKKLAHTILDRRRGSFCYELNGLFAEFLTQRLKWTYGHSMLRNNGPPLLAFSEGLASVFWRNQASFPRS